MRTSALKLSKHTNQAQCISRLGYALLPCKVMQTTQAANVVLLSDPVDGTQMRNNNNNLIIEPQRLFWPRAV